MWNGFQRPQKVEIDGDTATPTYGRFVAQPFERGFGTTIGNALRRTLLSSIEGAAITGIKVEGVLHEFSSMSGAVEDVTDLILNLKQVPLRMHGEDAHTIRIDVKGPGVVKAGDFEVDSQVEIVDPDVHICTLNEEGHLLLEARVCWGRGYASAERNLDEEMGIGWIPVDSVHSPVRRVNYKVSSARLGRTTDYEKLELEVWTNGTVNPDDAVSMAAELVRSHLSIFIGSAETLPEEGTIQPSAEQTAMDALLSRSIDDLELSVRSVNCLKNANIHTLRDLVVRSEKEMLETKNFGKKSLEELTTVLGQLGLDFGMDLSA